MGAQIPILGTASPILGTASPIGDLSALRPVSSLFSVSSLLSISQLVFTFIALSKDIVQNCLLFLLLRVDLRLWNVVEDIEDIVLLLWLWCLLCGRLGVEISQISEDIVLLLVWFIVKKVGDFFLLLSDGEIQELGRSWRKRGWIFTVDRQF